MKRALPWAAAFLASMHVAAHAQTVLSPSAQACLSCHSVNQSQGALPSLAKQDSAAIATALLEFRSGARHATIMNRIAKGYSEAEIKTLAAEIATVTGAKP